MNSIKINNIDTRKLCLLITGIISMFLFCTGVFLITSSNTSTNVDGKKDKTVFDQLIKSFANNDEPFNTLFMVKEKSGNNTDTMLLINFDPAKTRISVLSIPRDTYYEVKGSTIPKINSAYASGGANGAVKAVGDILNV
jgi:polyisoprenyl-teichoic acid--peptidoglycan teichoic acid transferase